MVCLKYAFSPPGRGQHLEQDPRAVLSPRGRPAIAQVLEVQRSHGELGNLALLFAVGAGTTQLRGLLDLSRTRGTRAGSLR